MGGLTGQAINSLISNCHVNQTDTEPFENDGYPVFGTDGLIFDGAEWYYEIHEENGNITYQHLKCEGDTTIHEKRPKIIVRSNTHYDKEGQTEITHEYVFEEKGMVYWWNKDLQEFTVLYDFSSEVGDEWQIEVGGQTLVMHVYELEIQYIDGIPYKRMTISDANGVFSGTVMSNIGHLTSFFPEKLMDKSAEYTVDGLRCYWLDDVLVLKLGDVDCDEIYEQHHHDLSEIDLDGFRIYPNPTNGVLFVVGTHRMRPLEWGTHAMHPYKITNLLGQTVKSGYVTYDYQQIDVHDLTDEIYFITIGNQTQKIIINTP